MEHRDQHTPTPLWRLLEAEGRKQSWLAEQVGVSRTQMGLWARGLHVPHARQLQIAEALGRDVDEVFPQHEAAA